MNYTKVYRNLIDKANNRKNFDEYTEKHHIIPKSEGGGNDIKNIVELTPKEHFVAHKLLYLENPNIKSRVTTFWLMSNNNRIKSGRIYEEIKLKFVKLMGKAKTSEHKKKISESLKGVPKSKKHIEKMVNNLPNRSGSNNPNYGKGKALIIEGVEYSSIRIASDNLGINSNTLIYRCKSDTFPNYNYKKNR